VAGVDREDKGTQKEKIGDRHDLKKKRAPKVGILPEMVIPIAGRGPEFLGFSRCPAGEKKNFARQYLEVNIALGTEKKEGKN